MAVKQDFLSILIPVYNPPINVFRKLLKSLVHQMRNFPNVEIIVVDDGSDNDISWVETYEEVTYKRTENGGEPVARNNLLDMASGEYITFIDADDEITDNYLAVIFENMRAGYDWVSYNWTCDGSVEAAIQTKEPLMINCAVWAYSFRSDFIKNTRFNESYRLGCDVEWLHRLLTDESKHKHDPRIIYNYRWAGNDSSMCHKKLRGEKV